MQNSKWFVFTLLAIAQFMIVLDVSITNVALVSIKQDLHFDTNSLQWIITAYALTFGGFLLLGGRIADLFGRRRTLITGMIGFTLFSLLIGLSQSPAMLITLRALQGLAAALMSPAALSIVLVTFTEGPERNKALAYWGLVASGGAAMGLLLGGVLTQYLGWRWDFFINVPIGLLVTALILQVVPAHEKEAADNRLDLPGAILVTSGLITLVYAFSQIPTWGFFSLASMSTLAVAIGLLAAFIFNESVQKHPLMPLHIFKLRNVAGANLIMAPVYASMMGMFFLTSLYIQSVLHYSPVITGLSFLPFPLILAFVSTRIPRLVGKFGFKPFLIIGPLLIGTAILWLSRLPVHGTYFIDLLPTLIMMPIGVGMTFMPIIVAATSGVKPEESGLASGLISTSQQMGGALGLAILSSIAAAVTTAATSANKLETLVIGYDRAFLTAVGFITFALILAIFVIKPQPKRAA